VSGPPGGSSGGSSGESDGDLRALAELCARIFAGTGDAWPALEEAGLTLLGVPEEAGGSGGSPHAAAVVLRESGRAGAAVPLAEAQLAGWLLAGAGLPVPPGPLTVAATAGGLPTRVPWGRSATVVVLAGERRVLLLAAERQVREGHNVAGEPRDEVRAEVAAEGSAPRPCAAEFALRYALARAVQLAGAAEQALALSVRYTGEREQFGRPLGRFQAVQQALAELAGEVATMRAAADAALGQCAAGFGTPAAAVAVAAAKTVTGQGAGVVARIAHQLHGAIGFTDEHPLHRVTTCLWAWREEAGTDAAWAESLGRRLLAPGAPPPWHLMTSP
jgi:acyl-CoA dehydrogenase